MRHRDTELNRHDGGRVREKALKEDNLRVPSLHSVGGRIRVWDPTCLDSSMARWNTLHDADGGS